MSVEDVLGSDKVATTMREFKRGKLRSGSKKGPKVKNRKQAVAIALSQARRAGAKIAKPAGDRRPQPAN